MLFAYEVQTTEGEHLTGLEEAPDRFALAQIMRNRNLFLISARPAPRAGGGLTWLKFEWSRVNTRDLMFFAGNLSVLLSAGLSLARSLDVIKRQTKKTSFKKIVGVLSERVIAGESLHRTLGAYPETFPPVLSAMARAGEGSGTLPAALGLAADQLKKSHDLRRKVKGALIYPALVLSAIVIIGILMMIFLVPTLVATFNDLDVELPFITKLIVTASDFLLAYWLWCLLGLVLLGAGAVVLIRSEAGQAAIQGLWLRLPAVRDLVKQTNAAVLMRTMSSLLAAGVSMVEAIDITAGVVQNRAFRRALRSSVDKIQTGATLSVAFKTTGDLYPVLVGEMAEVGEETGDLAGMLRRGAEFYEEQVDQLTKNLSTIIEPAMIILVGVAVGLFAFSMIGPLYSISNAF